MIRPTVAYRYIRHQGGARLGAYNVINSGTTHAIIPFIGICVSLLAERLSARHASHLGNSLYVYICMYPSRLGIQLFRALRANVVSRAPV